MIRSAGYAGENVLGGNKGERRYLKEGKNKLCDGGPGEVGEECRALQRSKVPSPVLPVMAKGELQRTLLGKQEVCVFSSSPSQLRASKGAWAGAVIPVRCAMRS